MTATIADTRTIDVEYQGMTRYIACCLLEGDGAAIIDPGPAVSLAKLEEGLAAADLALDDLDAVLLTHIHLDHAGAAGTIVRRNPGIQVYVHDNGAAHMLDPSRLLRSAERLYGDEMATLWGEFLAVPEENLRTLSGGETLEIAGRRLEVAFTPGHASHHVSYLDTSTGTAFVGDTAGIRIANDPYVLPITPPPDIDLEAWEESLRAIERWGPQRLYVTHFGVADGVGEHLASFRAQLQRWAQMVRDGVESGAGDEECVEAFSAAVRARLKESLPADKVALYQQGGAPWMSWHGLARYWRKKPEAT